MERKFEFSIDEFYHLYNRGNDKRVIFIDDSDKKRFIKLLFICNTDRPVIFKTIQGLPLDEINRGERIVALGSYCLMPNHFHVLAKETVAGGISKFMGKVLTAYSMYFNKHHDRTGKLFESAFRATHADTDEYLKYLFSYIHLNPIKLIQADWKENGITDITKAENFLRSYAYSSYRDYLRMPREEVSILDRAAFPEYFETRAEFTDFHNDWLNYKE